jgi:hypothetical protein
MSPVETAAGTGVTRFCAIAAGVGLLDGLLALALAGTGMWMFRLGSGGIGRSVDPEGYAGGMLLGGLGLLAWLLAGISAVAALACWRTYRKARRCGSRSLADLLALAFGLSPPTALLAGWIGQSLLRHV